MVRVLVLMIGLALAGALNAKEAPHASADPQLERRVMTLAEELRCLVCQNQTIADSNAPLAVDLRDQVREKMKQGASDSEIIDYMVQRYGDFVRYRPPVKPATLLLWFGPIVLLLAGFFILVRRLRASRTQPAAHLSDAEHARAATLLAGDDERR